jgi:hypothetical protein
VLYCEGIGSREDFRNWFFVAPSLLLTCEHVITTTKPHSDEVQVFWNQQSYLAQIVKIRPIDDLALLQVSFTNHPCVFLTKEETLLFDSLYSYGYSGIRRIAAAINTCRLTD